MNVLESIALRATSDLSAVEVGLRGIPNDDPNGAFLFSVMAKVKSGKAGSFEVLKNGEIVGFTVFEVESFGDNYRELVSIATHCPHTKGIIADLEQELLNQAKKLGCKSVRMHTVRHGLLVQAFSHGWEVSEIVIRKRL